MKLKKAGDDTAAVMVISRVVYIWLLIIISIVNL